MAISDYTHKQRPLKISFDMKGGLLSYILVSTIILCVFASVDTCHFLDQWFGKINFVTQLSATLASVYRMALEIVFFKLNYTHVSAVMFSVPYLRIHSV